MKVLFATDGSDDAGHALSFLEALGPLEGMELRVVSVVPGPAVTLAPYPEATVMLADRFAEIHAAERTLAARAVSEAADRLRGAPIGSRAAVIEALMEGDAAAELLREAREWNADLLVLGSRGLTGLDRFLLGSVARNVAKHARRPVLIARAPEHGLKRAVVATDGSHNAQDAVQFAGRFPLPDGCTLTALHVLKPYEPFPGFLPTDRELFEAEAEKVRSRQQGQAERLVSAARQQLAAAGRVTETAVRAGDAAGEILALAEEIRADLIVLGARGVSLIEGLLVGSVADRILNSAPCSLLIVP